MHLHTPDVSPSAATLNTAAVRSTDNTRGLLLALKEFAWKLEGTQRKFYLFLLICCRLLACWLSEGKLNILISSPEKASGNCYMKWEVEDWLIPVVPST